MRPSPLTRAFDFRWRLDKGGSPPHRSRAVRRFLQFVALSTLTVAVPAIAAERGARIGGVYALTGTSEIDAQVGPMPFRRTAHPTVEVRAEPAEGGQVKLTVSVDGRLCTLAAVTTAPETLTLTPQQHCPQSTQLDADVHLDLDGTLSAGQAIIHGARMTLTTEWVVVGELSMGAARMPVSGTIRTSQAGPRKP